MAGVHHLLARELQRFEWEHPGSKELAARIGGTAAGNVLELAAMRATLSEVLTRDASTTC